MKILEENGESKSKKSVYYKDKAAYNQALLEAIRDVRKQRVDDPVRGFSNSVTAFEGILLPDERNEVNAYKLDVRPHNERKEQALKVATQTEDQALKVEIMLFEYRKISWPIYKNLCYFLLEKSQFPDRTGDGQVNRDDVTISVYEALLDKIIDVLHRHGWLTFDMDGDLAGGGGGGLSSASDTDDIDDDLTP